MIKKFKIFESIEDDYYTVLIKLEEISKRIKRFEGRLFIDEEKENEYIIFTYIKLSRYTTGKYVFDPIKKLNYDWDEETMVKNTIFKETIKVDIPNLTMIWLDVKDTEEYLKYGAMYYAPDKKKFDDVDALSTSSR